MTNGYLSNVLQFCVPNDKFQNVHVDHGLITIKGFQIRFMLLRCGGLQCSPKNKAYYQPKISKMLKQAPYFYK